MYDHQKTDERVNAAALTAAGVQARFFAGLQPFIVRAIAVVVTTSPTVTAPVINFKRRPTPGSSAGEVSIGTITIPVATAIGKIVYKTGFSTKINPGEELVADVTTAATAGAGTIVATVEPSWEVPANLTNGLASV